MRVVPHGSDVPPMSVEIEVPLIKIYLKSLEIRVSPMSFRYGISP